MLKKLTLTVALGVTVLGGGTAAVASLSPGAHAPRLTPRTPAVKAQGAYGIFRRTAKHSDALPATLRARAAKVGEPLATRLVAQDAAVRLYARQTDDGQVCLLYYDGTSGMSANTCTSTAQAAGGDLPPEISMVSATGTRVYALMPDGVTVVTAVAADGTQRESSVSSNAVTVSNSPAMLRWVTADGTHHTLGGLSEKLPDQARSALARG
jgi:hypothetical protein